MGRVRGFPEARKSDSGCLEATARSRDGEGILEGPQGAGGGARGRRREQTGSGADARPRRLDRDPLDRALGDDGQCCGIARHGPQPLEAHRQWLLDLVAAEPDLTLEEIRARLKSEKRLKTGTTSVWRFYERPDITFKKTLHAAEQDRPDVAAARAELRVEQSKLDAPRLAFIDETAVTTKMVRHRGRSPRGERLVASVPHGHWKTLTLVAALRINGLTAPYVIDGAMDGPSFLAYIEQILAPT